MENNNIAKIFRDISELLEIKGENVFRIRAYARAADNIESLSESLEKYAQEDKLQEIPGIGKDLEQKIKEIIATGKLEFYDELKKSIPDGVVALLNIPSIGPKSAKLFFDKLNIRSIEDLQEAISNNKLVELPGIKRKTIENILKGIALIQRSKERLPFSNALELADEFIKQLNKIPQIEEVIAAGSLRRQKESIRDIDILVISSNPEVVMNSFSKFNQVKDVIAKGETKTSVITKSDIQVDCRCVEKKYFGSALMYFTGSKNFNIKLRMLAQKLGCKISEYGIFDKNDKLLAGATEEEIFDFFKMQFIPAEIREDMGEVELAQDFKLPVLIEQKDIKGDLHMHSVWSDGQDSISDMAKKAVELGYSYIAITDHSQSLKVAGGLSVEQLRSKKDEINKLNKNFKNFKILFSTEVDIEADGSLDYSDDILKEFDLVIAAIHTSFKQTPEKMTDRIIKACNNKYVNIIAHPTGRLWGARDSYEMDFGKVLNAAKETNTALEINSFSHRMDLNDLHAKQAKENGVKIAINTDAHAAEQLNNIHYGISVGRRAWLTKDDVLNTLSCEQLLKTLKK